MRWFTYCRPGAYAAAVGAKTGADRYLALLFGSDSSADEVTLADADALVIDPEIQKMYSQGCAALLVTTGDQERCVLIASALNAFKNPDVFPDDANDDTPPFIVGIGNQRFEYRAIDRYNACTSLIKYMGCKKCDDHGYVCAREAIPFLPELVGPDQLKLSLKAAPQIASFSKYRDGITQLCGFTFTAPTKTLRYGKNSALRGWKYHTFRDMERVDQEREAKANRAAKTREQKAFQQSQCTRCFVSTHCLNRRFKERCTGALPAEEIAHQDIREATAYLLRRNFTEDELRYVIENCQVTPQDNPKHTVALNYKSAPGQWQLTLHDGSEATPLRAWDSYESARVDLGWPAKPTSTLTDQQLLIAMAYIDLQNTDDTRILLGLDRGMVLGGNVSPYYGYLNARAIVEIGSLFYEYDRLPGVAHGKYRDPPTV